MAFEYWIEQGPADRPEEGGTDIFICELTGKVKLAEIAAALEACFSQPQPVKVMWRVQMMEVDFGLEDVTRLAEHVTNTISSPGKMAFVHGEQQFIVAVVNSVRNMRSIWKTNWRLFQEDSEARAWLLQESAELVSPGPESPAVR